MKRKVWYSIISIFVVAVVLASCIICRNEINLAIEKQKQNLKVFIAKTINYLTAVGDTTKIEDSKIWDISATESDNVIATLYSDGKLVISGNGAMKDYSIYSSTGENGEIIYNRAPWYEFRSRILKVEIQDGITNIGNAAFQYCAKLKEVLIANSVVKISFNSFYNCTNIEQIDISEYVTEIEDGFYYCSNLKAINVNENNPKYISIDGILFTKDMTALERYPSKKTDLKEYNIPETVITLGNAAFMECENFEKINFLTKNTDIKIGGSAFENCFNLIEINISDEVKKLNLLARAFKNCYNLERINNINTKVITSIGTETFFSCKKLVAEITIEIGSVYTIPSDTFNGCKKITKIHFNENCIAIGSGAFRDCNSLIELTLPEGIEYIGNNAFSGCTNLEIMELPDNIQNIGDNAFSGCKGFKITKLPNKLENIGDNAFSGCKNFEITELPSSLKNIGNNVFSGFTWFKITELPEGLESIGDNAFFGCINLTQMTIPKTVVKIGNGPFRGCTNLSSINVDEDNSIYFSKDGILFGNIEYKEKIEDIEKIEVLETLICYPAGKKDIEEYLVPNTVKRISDYAFYKCDALIKVEVQIGVTKVGEYCFNECKNLNEVILPEGIEILSIGIFMDCINLTTFEIPDSITTIKFGAFDYCENLKSIKIPKNVEEIESIFYYCLSLEKIEVDEENDIYYSIDGVLFGNIYNEYYKKYIQTLMCYPSKKIDIEHYIIPKNISYVKYGVFSYNQTLKSIQFPQNVELEWYGIEECQRIEEVIIPGDGYVDPFFFYSDYHYENGLKIKIYCNYNTQVYENCIFEVDYYEVIVDDKAPDITNVLLQRGENIGEVIINVQAEDNIQDPILDDEYAVVGTVGLRGKSYSFDGGQTWQEDVNITLPSGAENIKIQVRDALYNTSEYEREIIKVCDLSLTEEDNVVGVLWNDGILDIVGNGNIKDYTLENSPFYSHRELIKQVNISSEITSLGNYLFEGYTNITGIEIPQSVTKIGKSVFRGCDNLIEINVPEENANYVSENGILFDKNKETLICYPAGKGGEAYIIPEIVKIIDDSAFYGTKLKDIEVLENVIEIGNYAFYNTSELERVLITDRAITIGEDIINSDPIVYCRTTGAIYTYCQENSIRTEIDEQVPTIEDITFIGNYKEGKVEVIVDGAKDEIVGLSLRPYSFDGGQTWKDSNSSVISEGIDDIQIVIKDKLLNEYIYEETELQIWDISETSSDNVTATLGSDGKLVISGTGRMRDFDLEEVPWKDKKAEIKTIIILEEVTNIGNKAFEGTTIENIAIHANITDIGERVFENCSKLREITVAEENANYLSENGILYNKDKTILIRYPSVKEGKRYLIPETVKEISQTAFYNVSDLEEIVIQDIVERIEDIVDLKTELTIYCRKDSAAQKYGTGKVNIKLILDDEAPIVSLTEGENSVTIENAIDTGVGLSEKPYSYDSGVTWTTEIKTVENKELIQVRDALNNIKKYSKLEEIKEDDIVIIEQTCTTTTIKIDIKDEIIDEKDLMYSYDNGQTWLTSEKNQYTYSTKTENLNTEEQIKVEVQVKDQSGNILKQEITIKIKGHVEIVDEMKNSTCTETGKTKGKHCLICNKILLPSQIIPALGHSIEIEKAVSPTCTQTGLTEGKHCSVCNEILAVQTVIPARGHEEIIDKVLEATCTETGKTEGKHCSVCNEVLVKQEVIPAKGHKELIDEKVEATCTQTGLTEGKHCSVCNEILVKQEVIPAKGHTEVIDAKVEATCTIAGKTEGKHCSVCNEVLVKQEVIPAKGHKEVIDEKVEATCTTAGKTEGKHCSVCNEILVKQEVIPAKGHTEVIDAKVEATCTIAGKTEGKHCSVCNEVLVKQEEISATGHTEVIDEKVEATCTEAGKTEGKHCSVCSEVLVAQKTLPALGHKMSEWITLKEATCTDNGTKERYCSVCGENEIKPIVAKGHLFGSWTVTREATTTQSGEEQRICSECGTVQTRVKVYENPKTGDIIMISVISSIIAIIGIVVTTKILNQKKKES